MRQKLALKLCLPSFTICRQRLQIGSVVNFLEYGEEFLGRILLPAVSRTKACVEITEHRSFVAFVHVFILFQTCCTAPPYDVRRDKLSVGDIILVGVCVWGGGSFLDIFLSPSSIHSTGRRRLENGRDSGALNDVNDFRMCKTDVWFRCT